jgi:Amt family ammonium transporter
VFAAPSLGGQGVYDYVANATAEYSMSAQLVAQAWGVGTTIVWSGVVAIISYKLVDLLVGLRVSEEQEREGLDTAEHGERAYTA